MKILFKYIEWGIRNLYNFLKERILYVVLYFAIYFFLKSLKKKKNIIIGISILVLLSGCGEYEKVEVCKKYAVEDTSCLYTLPPTCSENISVSINSHNLCYDLIVL